MREHNAKPATATRVSQLEIERDASIQRAREALVRASDEAQRADALVAEAQARLAFERAVASEFPESADMLAARVMLGDLSAAEAVAIARARGFLFDQLARQLLGALPVAAWIDHARESSSALDWLSAISVAIERGDRDGALRLFEEFVCRRPGFELSSAAATLLMLRSWGRFVFAPLSDAMRKFERALLDAEFLQSNADALGLYAAWALTQNDATVEAARVALLRDVDRLDDRTLFANHLAVDSREPIVELFIECGEVTAAITLFERIARWPDARPPEAGAYWEFGALQRLLPRLARALVPDELARVEELLFSLWIEPAALDAQARWVGALRTAVRARVVALVDRADDEETGVALAAFGPSRRGEQLDGLLRSLEERGEAIPLVRRVRADSAFRALLIGAAGRQWRARSDFVSTREQALDLLLVLAREGHTAAIEALREWDDCGSLSAIARWFEGLSEALVRERIALASKQPRAREWLQYDARLLLVAASDEARARWWPVVDRALPAACITRTEWPRGARQMRVDRVCESLLRAMDARYSPSIWLVHSARRMERARVLVEPLVAQLLDELRGDLVRVRRERQTAVAILPCASAAQLSQLATLQISQLDASIAHAIIVGSTRAEREENVDLRALRRGVAAGWRGVDDDPWRRWVRERFASENSGRWVSELATRGIIEAPGFFEDCVALGLVDELLTELSSRGDVLFSRACNAVLECSSDACRSAMIARLLDVLSRGARLRLSASCAALLPVDMLVERWASLDVDQSPAVFDPILLDRLGGLAAIDRVGACVVQGLASAL